VMATVSAPSMKMEFVMCVGDPIFKDLLNHIDSHHFSDYFIK
jgi:hypothetical protein